METEHTETVVDKAVSFVKDMFGVHPQPTTDVEAAPGYSDTAPEITAEHAMRLNPNAYAPGGIGTVNAEPYLAPETSLAFERDLGGAPASQTIPAELYEQRSRSEVDELPREKSALELNSESARREDGE